MHTVDEIAINASVRRVFELAVDVTRWPEILPHYRWVKVVSQGWGPRTLEMAARRAWFPVKWTAEQRVVPAEGRVLYRHTAGLTAGMEVEWRIAEWEGGTHVVIEHRLRSRSPILRTRLAERVVAGFVHGIAERTLAHIKLTAETAEQWGSAPGLAQSAQAAAPEGEVSA
jgi:ribosome-associated toxin RatA of RatAB toxin-antitoxin module